MLNYNSVEYAEKNIAQITVAVQCRVFVFEIKKNSFIASNSKIN